jgi:hypothetical protein
MKPADVVRTGTIEIPGAASRERTFTQAVVSLAGAAGIALLVPFAVLLVGLPVVLFVRGVIEVVGWLSAFMSP